MCSEISKDYMYMTCTIHSLLCDNFWYISGQIHCENRFWKIMSLLVYLYIYIVIYCTVSYMTSIYISMLFVYRLKYNFFTLLYIDTLMLI